MSSTSDASPQPGHPIGILLDLIVTCLTPMFLDTAGGNVEIARQAAIHTIDAYRARDDADLLAVAQIVACGLAALFSLSASLADGLSLSMTLRLRGNAVALNRAADQNRKALAAPRPAEPPHAAAEPEDPAYETKVLADLAATQQRAAQTHAELAPATPADPITPRQQQAMWAFAMTDVAAEVTASLKNLPQPERQLASRKAAALSTCANQLLLGNVPPPLQSGDLAGFLAMAQTR